MSMTLSEVLARHDIDVADDLLADIEVPVLCGPQRQGDVLIVPRARCGTAEMASGVEVGRSGVAVVRGEASGNTHLLDAPDGGVWWMPAAGGGVTLGVVHVVEGAVAYLIHTDEHGSNAMGAGSYVLHGKREQADEIRRVAD